MSISKYFKDYKGDWDYSQIALAGLVIFMIFVMSLVFLDMYKLNKCHELEGDCDSISVCKLEKDFSFKSDESILRNYETCKLKEEILGGGE